MAGDLQLNVQIRAGAEARQSILEGGEMVALPLQLRVIGGADVDALKRRIMTKDGAAVAAIAHVELNAVAAVGEGVGEGGQCVLGRKREPAPTPTHMHSPHPAMPQQQWR